MNRPRYGYQGLGWIGWQSSQPGVTFKGIVSKPTVAISVVTRPRLGFNGGPLFFLRSFYVTGFCRNYLQLNVTGYVKVRPPAALLCMGYDRQTQ